MPRGTGWISVLALALALAVGLVHAQEGEKGEKGETGKKETADEKTEEEPDPFTVKVLELLVKQGNGVGLRDQFIKGMKMGLPDVPEDFFDGLIEEEEFQHLERLVVGIYRKHWTPEEIDELLAFYDTPLGKKVASRQNAIMEETFQVTQTWGMTIVPRITQKLLEAPGSFGLPGEGDEEDGDEAEDPEKDAFLEDPEISDEQAAVRFLRKVSSLQAVFREGDRDDDRVLDFASSLEELAEARLLARRYATGEFRGYRFGISGDTFDWQVSASPADGNADKRNFILCTDGVVRFVTGKEPATCESPAVLE